jgi:hypothetical protein
MPPSGTSGQVSLFQKSGLSDGPEDSPMSWFTSQPLPLGDEAAKLTDTAPLQFARDNPEH